MGGGLMQLVAYGSQDIYLSGKPQITFFKAVYRRHTNFAIESIPQEIQASAQFGSKVTVTISRNGDLLKNIWLEYSPYDILEGVKVDSSGNNGVTVAANLGHSLIDYIDLEIGGILVDRTFGKWLTIWNYLTECNPTGQQGAVDKYSTAPGEYYSNGYYTNGDNAVTQILPRSTKYARMSYNHRAQVGVISNEGAPQLAWIPLNFWFCKNPGLALPLIALQYHEVKLYIQFNQLEFVRTGTHLTGREFSRFNVYSDYVYLDTVERKQYAQNAHEYLVEQLQIMTSVSASTIKLAFNHPVKFMAWTPVCQPVAGTDRTNVVPGGASPNKGFTPSTLQIKNTYKIVLNGAERFNDRDITYFTRNQVWEAFTGYGSVLFPDSVAAYSFALRPEEHQPSGTCNFSRIDSALMIRSTTFNDEGVPTPDVIDIYGVNVNVFRIMQGMGAMAFSN